VPHKPINLSATEPAMALVARNDANEQEHVVTYRDEITNQQAEWNRDQLRNATN
jgi:hypothetical protein